MLVDSFDKITYAPTRSFDTRVVDSGDKKFKSILKENSENSNFNDNSNSIIQRNSTICRPLREFNSIYNAKSKNINAKPQVLNDNSQSINNKSYKSIANRFDNINDKYQINKDEQSTQLDKVHIGTLSDDTPTVSELLYNTPKYKNRCWEVLENDVNSSKRFKKIPAGTDIYLDKETSEIVWEKEYEEVNFKKVKNLRSGRNSIERELQKNELDSTTKSIIRGSDFFEKKAEPALYRSITLKHTNYSSENDLRNNNYNSETDFEIPSYKTSHKNKKVLNEAVKEFIGEDYSKIDCYELVVNGLKNMGVKYSGKDGLGKHLIDKAINEGYSENHYLTGEGLAEATGHSIYNKTILNVKSPISQAHFAMNEMNKVLKEGQILSFSTHSRGHTGVISRKDGVWTFINSGYMDNNIAGKNGRKQVGEEILSKELENWFKLAGKKKEGLQITLGDIDLSKLAQYSENKQIISES